MTEYKYQAFANRLNTILRSKNDASGSKLASKISQNPSTVNRWRSGEARPGLPEVIDAIARVLELSEEDRVGLLYDADYGWYVEAGTYRNTEDSTTIDYIRSEAEKRGIDSYVIDKLFHALTGHPSPDYEYTSTKSSTRWVFTISTLAVTLLLAILFMALFTPATLETLRGIIERPFSNISTPTPTATSQPDDPVVQMSPMPFDTATPTLMLQDTATPTPTATLLPITPTPTATANETSPTATTVVTRAATPLPAIVPTPVSTPPCNVEIISPQGSWPVLIGFRSVPDGTDSERESFNEGSKAFLHEVSDDKRWYRVDAGSIEGWAEPQYFSDCIPTAE